MQSRNECFYLEYPSTRNILQKVYSSTVIFIFSTFLSILIAFILVTNVVVIISIVRSMWTDRHTHMKLNISKILMTSMAVSDLFIASIPMSLELNGIIVNENGYQGYYTCFFRILSHVFMCTVSVYHVMFMAIDRYLAVCRPFTYRKLTRTSAYLMVVVCWMFPACQLFIPMIWNLHIRGVETYNECARINDVCLFKFNPIYHIVLGIMSIHASLVITICLYAVVMRAAQQFHKRKINFNAKFTKNLGIHFNSKSGHKNGYPEVVGKKTCIGSPHLSYSGQFQDLMSTVQPDKKVFSCCKRLTKLTTTAMHIFSISKIHLAMQELFPSNLERLISDPKEIEEMDENKDIKLDELASTQEISSISNQLTESMNVQEYTFFCQSKFSLEQRPAAAVASVCFSCSVETDGFTEYCLTHAGPRTISGCSYEIFTAVQHVTSSSPSEQESKSSTQESFKMVHKMEVTDEIKSQEIENVQSQHLVNQSKVAIYTMRSCSFDQSPMVDKISRVASDPSLKATDASQTDKECTNAQSKPNVKHISKLHDTEFAHKTPTKHNLKAAKTIGMVIICFVICWLPQGVWAILSEIDNECIPTWLVLSVGWLSYTNSALNPLVYCYNTSIRKTVLSLICPSRCHGNQRLAGQNTKT